MIVNTAIRRVNTRVGALVGVSRPGGRFNLSRRPHYRLILLNSTSATPLTQSTTAPIGPTSPVSTPGLARARMTNQRKELSAPVSVGLALTTTARVMLKERLSLDHKEMTAEHIVRRTVCICFNSSSHRYRFGSHPTLPKPDGKLSRW